MQHIQPNPALTAGDMQTSKFRPAAPPLEAGGGTALPGTIDALATPPVPALFSGQKVGHGYPIPRTTCCTGQAGNAGGALQRELQSMAQAHEGEAAAEPQAAGGGRHGMAAGGSFVRGHAAQELAFASEEMDAA